MQKKSYTVKILQDNSWVVWDIYPSLTKAMLGVNEKQPFKVYENGNRCVYTHKPEDWGT